MMLRNNLSIFLIFENKTMRCERIKDICKNISCGIDKDIAKLSMHEKIINFLCHENALHFYWEIKPNYD